MNENKLNFAKNNKSYDASTMCRSLFLGRLDLLRLSQCFRVNTTESQTSNARSATGWSSIHLVEQNLIGNTSDVPSR